MTPSKKSPKGKAVKAWAMKNTLGLHLDTISMTEDEMWKRVEQTQAVKRRDWWEAARVEVREIRPVGTRRNTKPKATHLPECWNCGQPSKRLCERDGCKQYEPKPRTELTPKQRKGRKS